MRKLLVKARTPIGVAVIGVGLLAVGGTATAAVVVNSPATDEVSDVVPAPTEPVETTAVPEAPASTDAPAPVPADSPVVDTPAANVQGVTEPEPVDSSAPASDPVTPAPDVPVAEQSFGGQPPPGGSIPKLPGEVGYVAPDGSVTPPA